MGAVMHVKKLLVLVAALSCALFSAGCYTKFMGYQGEVLAGRDSTGAGADCGECLEVAPASDRREVCVWERDMFGYPDLRCYNTNYSSTWVYFHNTPWWYRDSYSWYDTRGCPPYYYYDRISGFCRYYDNGASSYPRRHSGRGGGGGGTYNEPPPRRNSRIALPPTGTSASVQTETPAPSSSGLPPMFSGGSSAPLSPVGAPSTSSSASSPGPSSSVSSGQALSKPNDAPQQKQEAQASQPQAQPQPQPQREPPKRDEKPGRRSSRGF